MLFFCRFQLGPDEVPLSEKFCTIDTCGDGVICLPMFLKYFLGVFLRIREKLLRSMREGQAAVFIFIYSTEPDPDPGQCPVSFSCHQNKRFKFFNNIIPYLL
jgi:hypothetical protein